MDSHGQYISRQFPPRQKAQIVVSHGCNGSPGGLGSSGSGAVYGAGGSGSSGREAMPALHRAQAL
jgi:hypothetical protein